MRRRQFIVLAAGGIVAPSLLPRVANAQRPEQKRRVAVLMGGLAAGDAGGRDEATALEAGLKELGWNAGGNIVLDYRWPGAELDSVRAAAGAIVDAHPDLVISRSTPATAALMNSGLPVVFVLVVDPLGSGFVQSLGHPGGNLTGFSNFESSVAGKWLGLLKEAAPQVSRAAMLFNPATAPFAPGYLASAHAAGPSLGVAVEAAPCAGVEQLEAEIAARSQAAGSGLIVITDTFLVEHREIITARAAQYRLPAIYGSRIYVPGGGLMAYAADYPDIFRRAAGYVDRILRGARPADLPVQEPDKYTLSLNLKTAQALGLTLPQSLVSRADEVIE